MSYEEYLAHEGILGMKWGHRNGPPYPLSSSQMTPKERAKNQVSKFAANVKVAKAKEREQVRLNKFKEKERIRQNKVKEKERIRQNKVAEKESARQNRADERELTLQNIAAEEESRRQYEKGRKYVRNALIGIGAMAFTAYKVSQLVAKGKAKQG